MSPILDLQRRLREVGRIRIGEKKTAKSGKSFPSKLDTFRLTSRDRAVIDAAAAMFGGTVEPWAAPDGSAQWQVTTGAAALEVIVPPADMAFSQAYELWSGGGCVRRCDGANELIGDQPCVCDPENRECTPHTRLSLILPDLPVVGLWRLDTSGWNAAQELAGSVDLARAFAKAGQYLPAELRLEVREQKKPGEATKKFAVPCLDLKVSMRRLAAIGAGMDPVSGEITGPTAPALAAPSFSPVPVAALPEGPSGGSIKEQLAAPTRARGPKVPLGPTGIKPPGARPAVEVSEVLPPSDDGGPVEGTEGFRSPGPPATASDADAKARAQSVAMRCRDAGLDDDGRHRFLEAFSRGWYSSAKDVPAEALPELFAALVRFRRGEVEPVEQHDGTWRLVDRTRPVVGSTPTTAEQPVTDSESRTPDWHALIDATPGVGVTMLLNRAKKEAHHLGVTVPESLDDITDEVLSASLLDWLESRAA